MKRFVLDETLAENKTSYYEHDYFKKSIQAEVFNEKLRAFSLETVCWYMCLQPKDKAKEIYYYNLPIERV